MSPGSAAEAPSHWLETEIEVSREDADRLSDALLEAGALSVQVDDADAATDLERPVFGEPGMPAPPLGWDRSRLTIMTGIDDDADGLLRAACASLGVDVPAVSARRPVRDRDWVGLTQAQFEPMTIGRRLWIGPSWHTGDVRASGRLQVTIDPGLAFGTGSHATTHLCLEWLDEHLCGGETVLDYGCGSGILAIAAARLGAREIAGIDIDPLALQAAAANATVNHVRARWIGPEDAPPPPANVVLANILASPLKVLAPLLEERVAAGGVLVIAGLLTHQVDDVAACYRRIPMRPWRSRDGWSCLVGRRV